MRERLSTPQLAELTRFYADEAARGRYPWVEFDADERWHQRIYRDRRVDVWLISWLPTQGTSLHDHGGSQGAFTVLEGTLTESAVRGFGDRRAAIADELRGVGETVRFGPHYVHDVSNAGPAPAVSVHAYSPPLTSMRFYDLVDGDVVPLGTLKTDDPEPETAAVALAS